MLRDILYNILDKYLLLGGVVLRIVPILQPKIRADVVAVVHMPHVAELSR
jgi:hypothetical protein